MKWQFAGSLVGAVATIAVAGSGPAQAARCGNAGNFPRFLAEFKREAAAQGLSRGTIAALDGLSFDPAVIAADRRQAVFSQSFLEFSDRMVAKYRLQGGASLIRKHARTFARIERDYGVPAPVLVAFWGLETDFGANIGKGSTLRALATLASDCRRPEVFQPQLMAALKIIERGDLRPEEMVGPWAGEMGQTQFLPTHYLEFGVDYDGDGRRNLLRSSADALASSANLLAHMGWKRGQPWIEEVRVPGRLPWDQADVDIRHPRSQWAKWGVTRAGGKALPADGVAASLLLPMGRSGPAFLAYDNFRIYLEWNQSLVYATTAAYYATRLAGAGPVHRGSATADSLSFNQIKELQRALERRGYDVGKIDGIIGSGTRAAVKAMQVKLGLPADSYPTPELLARLR
jgi:lytic murein transglycosylase